MKTACFIGVILPQTPVHLAQILNSIFQWGDFNQGTFTFNPNSMKISNWTTNVANQSNNNLDWPGFTCFVAKTYQSRITLFWGKILNSNFVCVKKLTFRNSGFFSKYFFRWPLDAPFCQYVTHIRLFCWNTSWGLYTFWILNIFLHSGKYQISNHHISYQISLELAGCRSALLSVWKW